MNLDRRWWIAIAVLVVVAVALIVNRVAFQPPQECRPVQELLDFNQAQTEVIGSASGKSEGVPSQAEEAAYRAWADGLADRAQNVSAPDFAFTAGQVATLADDFVEKLGTLRTQAQSRAPGAPTPPVVFEMDALSTQISQKLAELSDACS
ncbi:hypothetical protein [Mycobacterium deserti]|uniref:Secreted protein n=1 Tax=Mycobacterium deserti TaxID=2978347 RepID=A0ABT2MHB6_9MYCO|nr:hypothetical protein [Mycobacterium deserti]MCT7661684.1 hypothetical protein [Mycobacterium deserti]